MYGLVPQNSLVIVCMKFYRMLLDSVMISVYKRAHAFVLPHCNSNLYKNYFVSYCLSDYISRESYTTRDVLWSRASVRMPVCPRPHAHYCTDLDVTWGSSRDAPSCALLGGFAIGARVALLWQHNANAKC